ncbi:hypothetical protein [Mastigocladopsis repens]|uniref:hypothetical protein n=1 Tax=Mastigocladopsis repens TaxID=221287 RepID=UPI00036BE6BA|nr:hypothetical protein [Mastigocladopsis repens]
MPKAKANRVRKSLSLPRFTPDEGTPLALVADYLNGLEKEEMPKLVREMLVMCLLPLAKHHCGQFTQKQVRDAYLIARRMAENHFGIMAIELGLDASVYAYVPQPLSNPTVVDGNGGNGSTPSPAVEVSEEESTLYDSSLISGQVDSGFMGSLFG